MEKTIWIGLVLFAGAFLPIQAGMNSKLAKAGNSPLYASLVSFIVGVVVLAVYILATTQQVSWRGLKEAPLYAWGGGIIGAFYVTITILAFSKIGPGLTFALVIAGQLLISILMEHFQVMDTPTHRVSIGRVAGLLLIVAGVILVKEF